MFHSAFAWHVITVQFILLSSVIHLFLTCVAVEMCKVSKTGAAACIHVGRGSKDISTQVTEEVKLLVMELLLMSMSTTHHWRLAETRKVFEKTAYICMYKFLGQPLRLRKTRGSPFEIETDRECVCQFMYLMCHHANVSISKERWDLFQRVDCHL